MIDKVMISLDVHILYGNCHVALAVAGHALFGFQSHDAFVLIDKVMCVH